MKKRWIALGLIAIILAGTLYLGGMSLINWDFSRLDGTVWEDKSYTMDANEQTTLKGVSLDLANANLTVVKGDTFALEYQESHKSKVNIYMENGVLKVEERYKWMFFQMFDFHTPDMKLTLPQVDDFSVEASNGDVSLNGYDFKTLTLDLSNGKIDLRNINVQDGLYADTTNGVIELTNVTAGDSIRLDSNNGAIRLNNVTASEIDIDGTNGKIDAAKITARKVNVDSVNGSILLREAKVQHADLQTVNGRINAQFLYQQSLYSIDCKTVNGDVNVPNQSVGQYSVRAETVNGDIELSFAAWGN